MPHLSALVKRMQDEPFTVLGVNSYDSEEDYRKGVEEFGLSWPTVFQGGSTPVADLYRVKGYPTVYVIGPDGRIAAKGMEAQGEGLVRTVETLLAKMKAEEAEPVSERGQ